MATKPQLKNPGGRVPRAGGPTRVIGVRFSDTEIDELNKVLARAHQDPKFPDFETVSEYIRWCVLPSMRKGAK